MSFDQSVSLAARLSLVDFESASPMLLTIVDVELVAAEREASLKVFILMKVPEVIFAVARVSSETKAFDPG